MTDSLLCPDRTISQVLYPMIVLYPRHRPLSPDRQSFYALTQTFIRTVLYSLTVLYSITESFIPCHISLSPNRVLYPLTRVLYALTQIFLPWHRSLCPNPDLYSLTDLYTLTDLYSLTQIFILWHRSLCPDSPLSPHCNKTMVQYTKNI